MHHGDLSQAKPSNYSPSTCKNNPLVPSPSLKSVRRCVSTQRMPLPNGRVLLLTAGLVALLAVLLRRSTSDQPSTPPATDAAPDGWYVEHSQWLQRHAAAAAAMRAQMRTALAAASNSTTLADTAAALQGSTLPKGVQVPKARQLLIDKQLLAHSLSSNGFAAARVAALRRHYGYSQATEETQPHGSDPQQQQEQSEQQQQQQQKQHEQQQQRPSRGILIVGGSRTHLGNAYILLRVLREQLACELPVEVVYYGRQELDPAAAGLVRSLAAAAAASGGPLIKLIDGLAVHQQYLQPLLPHPEVALTSWVAKVHALCWVTSFQQVLLLDSDNLPTQDPSRLFHHPTFKSHGFMTWPDFWTNLWMEPAVYNLLNLTIPWEAHPQTLAAESGQLLIDRARHADVLEWLWLLNAHAGVVYRCLVGDKDTYRLAFELAGKGGSYWQVPHPPRQLLLDAGPHKQHGRFIHLGMGQASPDGSALLFIHRTARGKFFPWCAASRQLPQGGEGGSGCQPSWLSMPVVQQQLLASVPDAGSMRFDACKLDTAWYTSACQPAADQGVTEGGDDSAVEAWRMQLPVCSNYSTEQVPIPLVPVGSVAGLSEFMAGVNTVFAEAAAVLDVPLVDRWKVFWGIL